MKYTSVYSIILAFLFSTSLNGQCDCENCPLFIPSNTTQTSDIEVSGLVNDQLGQNGQDVCGIYVEFFTDAIRELTFILTAPDGSQVTLFTSTGLNVNQGINFALTFLPCGDTPMPDAGFPNNFNTNAGWQPGGSYSGTYFPESDCLEDFTGSANGTWTLSIEDDVGADDSTLFDWQIIFCDPDGTDCGEEPTCIQYEVDPFLSEVEYCEGDPSLDFNIIPSYVGGMSPDPALYDITYVVSDATTGTVIEIVDDPDLTSQPTGNYTICALVYLIADQPLLPSTSGGYPVSDIVQDIADEVYCAQITCQGLTINPDHEDPVLDWSGITELCIGEEYVFNITNYTGDDSDYQFTTIGGFSSLIFSGGTITITPLFGPIEICFTRVGDCNALEDCLNVTLNPEPTIDIVGELNTCYGGEYEYTVTNLSGITSFTWIDFFPDEDSYIISDNGNSVTMGIISPPFQFSASVCLEYTTDCGTMDEYCIDITPPNDEICGCTANAGTLNPPIDEECEGNFNLDLTLAPTYLNPVDQPNPVFYSYGYYITDVSGLLLEFTDDPDLTAYTPGEYFICGFSYLTEDISIIPAPDGSTTSSDILNEISNETAVYCGDITSSCFSILINDDFDDPQVDWDGINELCVGTDYNFTIINYDNSAVYDIYSVSGNFNSFTAGSNDIISFNPAAGADIEICIDILNDCNPNTVCKTFILSDIPENPILDGPNLVCEGDEFTVQNLTTSSGTANWSVSGGGLIISSNDNAVTVQATMGSANVCVDYSNLCGTSVQDCWTVIIVEPLPDPILDWGNIDAFCVGETYQVFISNWDQNENYSTDLNGTMGTYSVLIDIDQSGSIFITPLEPGGIVDVCIELGNPPCVNEPACLNIPIIDPPIPPILDGPTTVCAGQEFSINNSIDILGTPNWTINGDGLILSSDEFGATVIGNSGQLLICLDNTSDCDLVEQDCVTVEVEEEGILPQITLQPDQICQGEQVTYMISNFDPTLNYNVNDVSGNFEVLTFNDTEGSITVMSNNGSALEWCMSLVDDCNTDEVCFVVNIDPLPTIPILDGPSTVCEGEPIFVDITNLDNDLSPIWTVSDNGIIVNGQGEDFVAVNATIGTVEICVELSNSCGSIEPECISVLVTEPTPVELVGPASICGSLVTDLSANTIFPDTDGVWSLLSGPGTATFTNPNQINTTVEVLSYGEYIFEFSPFLGSCESSNTITVLFTQIETDIAYTCSNGNYTATVTILSGEAPYFVNGTELGDNVFISSPVASGTALSIEIQDNSGCFTMLSLSRNCDCDSDAGNMPDVLISVCGTDQLITVMNDGNANLDNDDIGVFVLHNGTSSSLGSIIQTTSDGVFDFSAPLLSNTIYYVSYLVGNQMGGIIDLNDICLSVSNGQPIVWYSLPQSSLPDSLSFCTDTFSILGTSVANSFDAVNWEIITGPTPDLSPVIYNGSEFQFFLGLDGTYQIQAEIIENGCFTLDTITIDINLLDYTINYTCEPNGDYSVFFEIEGGDAPFDVNNNLFNDRMIDLGTVLSGDSLVINVKDENGCELYDVVAFTQCDCIPPTHVMPNDTLILCDTTESFNASVLTQGELSSEDTFSYILYSNSSDPINTMISISMDGAFSFTNGMVTNEYYYISYVSGDSLSSGMIDILDPCLAVSSPQLVLWLSEQIIDAGIDQIVCGLTTELLGISESNTTLWTLIQGETGAEVNILNANALNTEITTDLPGRYSFELQSMHQNCEVYDTLIIDFTLPLMYSSVISECDENDLYSVSVFIDGGISPYFVDGSEIVGNEYTLEDISSNSPFEITINDSGPCDSLVFMGVKDCSCPSIPGEANYPFIDLCEGEDYQVNYTLFPQIGAGFTDAFILHDGNSTSLGNIISVYYSATLTFDDNIPLDVPLYLSPVVGPLVGSEIDFDDDCTLLGLGFEIIWRSNSSFTVTGPSIACEVDTIDLIFNFESNNFPIEFEVIGENFSNIFTVQSSDEFLTEIPIDQNGNFTISILSELCISTVMEDISIELENCDCNEYDFTYNDSVCIADNLYLPSFEASGYSGVWSLLSSNAVQPPSIIGDSLILSQATTGTTIFELIPDQQDACDTTYQISLYLEEHFDLSLTEDYIFFCPDSDIIVNLNDLLTNSAQGDWISIGANLDINEGMLSIENLPSEIYQLQFLPSITGVVCPVEDIVLELEILEPPSYVITSNNPDCFGEGGSISILDANDAQAIIINGEELSSPDITQLQGGVYSVEVISPNLCSYTEEVILNSPVNIDVELDGEINLSDDGNSAVVSALLSNSSFDDVDVVWTVDGSGISPVNDSVLIITISEDVEISILVTNEDGCTAEDLIILSLEAPNVDIILPNVIAQNSSSGNTSFIIPPYETIARVESFLIFDRWGMLVYSAENYIPSINNQGWDGTMNGIDVVPGVYVYSIRYEDNTSESHLLFGDVTVLR